MKNEATINRKQVEQIMLASLKNCGVSDDIAKSLYKKLTHMFLERFVSALLITGRVRIWGMMVGNIHPQSKRKMIIRLSSPEIKHKGGKKDGFDFKATVDR